MTVSWELFLRAREHGRAYAFLATGQTGILLAGSGIAIDRVISDFVAGAMEKYTVAAARGHDLVLVEGQGSLVHPFYSGVTLGMIHGAQPDGMILCHVAGRTRVRHAEDHLIPSLGRLIHLYEDAAAWVRPATVIGLALATHHLDERAARRALNAARAETGLAVEDVIRYPTGELLAACESLRSPAP
jgi:uncharacterized NAD-dependent epimerase/dehydratase family protein